MNIYTLTAEQVRVIQRRVFWDMIHWNDPKIERRFQRIYDRLNQVWNMKILTGEV